MKNVLQTTGLLLLMLLGLRTELKAQFKVLHHFADSTGEYPRGIIAADGVLYGTTILSGTHNSGVIFSMNSNGTGYKVLYNFSNPTIFSPVGNLAVLGNTLYGMTAAGGSYGNGLIYAIQTNGTDFRVLYNFTNSAYIASGSPIIINGALYDQAASRYFDTTLMGNVFKIDTNGSNFTVLHTFEANEEPAVAGVLLAENNTLYGAGSNFIYSMDTAGNGYKHLINFNAANQQQGAPFIVSRNLLYGSVQQSSLVGAGVGSVFAMDTAGGMLNPLYSITDDSTIGVPSPLLLVGKTIYGYSATSIVSIEGGKSQYGSFFSMDSDGSNFITRIIFNGDSGQFPTGTLALIGDTIYGTTANGGTAGEGIIFSYQISKSALGEAVLTQPKNEINLYPNPTTGNVFITGNENAAVQKLQIFDILGRCVYTHPSTNAQLPLTIDLSAQAKGVYILQIQQAQQMVCKRISIE